MAAWLAKERSVLLTQQVVEYSANGILMLVFAIRRQQVRAFQRHIRSATRTADFATSQSFSVAAVVA